MRHVSNSSPCPRCSSGHRPRAGGRTLPRPQLLAVLISLALSSGGWLPARADSGVLADTAQGNVLTPRGSTPLRARDADGMGEAENSRSPSGFLYAQPWALTAVKPATDAWQFSGGVELGGLYLRGDKDAAKFREYRSNKDGLVLSSGWLAAEHTKDALYFDLNTGGLGGHDAYLAFAGGKRNAWKLSGFVSEIDHVFTTTYKNLWSGTGSSRLTLNPPLLAGPVAPATAATVDIAIGNAALAAPNTSLSVLRQRGGLRLDLTLSENWKAYSAFTSEKRQGARPFGLVMGGGGGTGGVEVPESIDYDTHDLVAGLEWNRGLTSVNLQASASLFRNNVGTMTVDNPILIAAANGITRFPRVTYDLYPDNDAYTLKGEVAHAVPAWANARFTALVSATRMRQNDALIPYTEYAGASINNVAGGAWNSVDALSRKTAGAAIDTRLLDLTASLQPADSLGLKARVRRYETQNSTEYWACNPLTGQWGRLINDGSGAAMAGAHTAGGNPAGTAATAYDALRCNVSAIQALNLVPSAGNVNIASIPYEYQQTQTSLAADWRMARGQNVAASLERENFDRAHRERARTWEDKLKLSYVNRALPGGTLRASLETGRRRGSTYVADPYEEFLSASLGPLPTATGTAVTSWIHINDLHRKFDLADRDQTVISLKFNHALRQDLDIALTLQGKEQKYPSSAFGRSGAQRQNSGSLDLNWQPGPETSVYAYAAHQESSMFQRGLQQNACVLGSTYYVFSDGSIATTATLTPAQQAAGITVVGNSGVVTGANFLSLCGSASATSPLYPLSRAWTARQSDTSTSVGVGINHVFGKVRGEANANYTRGRTSLAYTFNPAALGLATSGAPSAVQQTVLNLIGSGMPDMLYTQSSVEVSAAVPVSKLMSVRLLARHDAGKVRDWHYDGVAANPTPSNNQQTYLDSGPQDYRVTTIGAFVQISW